MSSFGHSVNQRSGAILPVNTATLVPTLNDTKTLDSSCQFQFQNVDTAVVLGSRLYMRL